MASLTEKSLPGFLRVALLVIALGGAFALPVGAQQGAWINYSAADGLTCSFADDIVIDSQGWVWAATNGGVSVFDGQSWRTYGLADGLPSENVQAIAIDPQGRAWCGTDKGLAMFDGQSWGSWNTARGLVADDIWTLYISPTGLVWYGTPEGAGYFNGQEWQKITTENGLSSNEVHAIVGDPHGNIWFGVKHPYLVDVALTNGQWQHFGYQEGMSLGVYTGALAVDGQGRIWAGVMDRMAIQGWLNIYDGQTWHAYPAIGGYTGLPVFDIAFGPEGDAWLATPIGLMHWLDENTVVDLSGGLADKRVRAVAVAPDGSVWVATGSGVSRYSLEAGFAPTSPWKAYTTNDGLAGDHIIDIDFAPNNGVWVATETGVSVFDGQRWTSYSTKDGLRSNTVYAIDTELGGQTWFATAVGLSAFDGNTWRTYTTADGLLDNYVTTVYADNRFGRIWYGTPKGAGYLDSTGAWWIVTTAQGLSSNAVNAITLDKDGNIWFGLGLPYDPTSAKIDVFLVETGTWAHYSTESGLIGNRVSCLAIDYQRNLVWAGFIAQYDEGGGVGVFDGKSWKIYTDFSKTSSVLVYDIAFDMDWQPWLATQQGLVHIRNDGTVKVYTREDGLPTDVIRAVFVTGDGRVWVGLDVGLYCFTP